MISPLPNEPEASHCEICGDEIPFFEAINNKDRDWKICGAIECKNILEQQARLPETAFKVFLTSHRRVVEQRRQRIAVKEQLKKQEAQENELIFKQVVADYGQPEAPKHRVILPQGHGEQVPLSQERIEKYKAHLTETIAEAFKYQSVADVPNDNNQEAHEKLLAKEQRFAKQPRLKAISDHFCMICKGGCCSRGREHAYISVSSIRRLLDAQPDYTEETLLQEYLAKLGETSSVNACINQTNTGCALPRELRSSTCNQFHCASVTKYQDKISSDDEIGPVVVVQRVNALWNHSYDGAPNDVARVLVVTESESEDWCTPVAEMLPS